MRALLTGGASSRNFPHWIVPLERRDGVLRAGRSFRCRMLDIGAAPTGPASATAGPSPWPGRPGAHESVSGDGRPALRPAWWGTGAEGTPDSPGVRPVVPVALASTPPPVCQASRRLHALQHLVGETDARSFVLRTVQTFGDWSVHRVLDE